MKPIDRRDEPKSGRKSGRKSDPMTPRRSDRRDEKPRGERGGGNRRRAVAPRTGAGSATRKAPAISVWMLHHRAALTATLSRLRDDRLGTLLVALTLGIALALPMLLWVLVSELGDLTADWDDRPRINLFVDPALRTADVESLLTRLRANPEIAEVRWQSPEASLEEFVRGAGFSATLGLAAAKDGGAGAGTDTGGSTSLGGTPLGGIPLGGTPLGGNPLGGSPLPGVALVTPVDAVLAPARLRGLTARLETERGVEGVQLDLDWVLRLRATLDLVGRLGLGLAALLAIGVLLVVGSLIRMALLQRREEIVVLKLVGGTDAFVRRPFLYLGTLQGLAGGIAAWFLVTVAVTLLAGPALELARSYGSAFRLELSLLASAGMLLGTGALLGWAGARIAVGRTLVAIEP